MAEIVVLVNEKHARFNESREKILDLADWIVPGHGGMFEVKKNGD